MRYCSIIPCINDYYCRGFCKKHHKLMWRLDLLHLGYVPPRTRQVDDPDAAVRRYMAGESGSSIARSLGVNIQVLRRSLVAHGAEIRPVKYTFEAPGQIIDRYLSGESEKSIASSLGVSRDVVVRFLREEGVPRRTLAEANRLVMARRTPEERRRNTEAAHEAARHHVHTIEEKIKRAVTREREGLHISPTERRLQGRLEALGLVCRAQKAAGPYNIDIASGRTAIEVYGGSWHASGTHRARSAERFNYLLGELWNVVLIWIDSDRYPMSEHLSITVADWASKMPRHTDRGEFVVLRGDGSFVSRGSDDVALLERAPSRSR